jgi:hypothetical protein
MTSNLRPVRMLSTRSTTPPQTGHGWSMIPMVQAIAQERRALMPPRWRLGATIGFNGRIIPLHRAFRSYIWRFGWSFGHQLLLGCRASHQASS